MLPTAAAVLSLLSSAAAKIDTSGIDPKDVISRDVVILGGGGSGAHAAVRLREDFKKSVVVVEKEPILVRRVVAARLGMR